MTVPIDLAALPPPDVIERLDYETIKAQTIASYVGLYPEFSALVESEPALKLLEVTAWRELVLRARINDGARAVMVPHSVGTDLDNLVAYQNLTRRAGEDDAHLRRRFLLAPERTTVAGSELSYVARAIEASASMQDASAVSPTPGNVTVTALGGADDGAAPAWLATAVANHLSSSRVRPLTDDVTVQVAQILPFAVTAQIEVDSGPDMETVRKAAKASVERLCRAEHRLGGSLTKNAIIGSLFVAGVRDVTLTSPLLDVDAATAAQAPWCTKATQQAYRGTDADYPAGGHPFDGVTVTAVAA